MDRQRVKSILNCNDGSVGLGKQREATADYLGLFSATWGEGIREEPRESGDEEVSTS